MKRLLCQALMALAFWATISMMQSDDVLAPEMLQGEAEVSEKPPIPELLSAAAPIPSTTTEGDTQTVSLSPKRSTGPVLIGCADKVREARERGLAELRRKNRRYRRRSFYSYGNSFGFRRPFRFINDLPGEGHVIKYGE